MPRCYGNRQSGPACSLLLDYLFLTEVLPQPSTDGTEWYRQQLRRHHKPGNFASAMALNEQALIQPDVKVPLRSVLFYGRRDSSGKRSSTSSSYHTCDCTV
jgi:hypothetical protein